MLKWLQKTYHQALLLFLLFCFENFNMKTPKRNGRNELIFHLLINRFVLILNAKKKIIKVRLIIAIIFHCQTDMAKTATKFE